MGKKNKSDDERVEAFVNREFKKAFKETKETDGNMNFIQKTWSKVNWHSVWVVTKTLIILAVIAGSYYAGWHGHEDWYNSVKSEAKSYSAVVSKE